MTHNEMTHKWKLPYVKYLINLETLSCDLRRIMISKLGGYTVLEDYQNYCHYLKDGYEFEIDMNYQIHATANNDKLYGYVKTFNIVNTLIRLQNFKKIRALRESEKTQKAIGKLTLFMFCVSCFSSLFLCDDAFMISYVSLIIILIIFSISSYITMVFRKSLND